MSNLGKRIKKLRKEKDLTQEELGKFFSLRKSTISQYESGISNPDYDTLQKLANYFGVSLDYLFGRIDTKSLDLLDALDDNDTQLTAGGQALTPDQRLAIARALDNPSALQTVSRPILGPIHAGMPLLAEQNWEGQIEIPSYMKADYALRVEGDSMIYAGIRSGDIALFQESSYARHGQIVAAGIEEATWEAYLKFYIQKNGQVLLRSANPEYEDIEYGPKHRIIGILVGTIRDQSPTLADYQRLLQVKGDKDDQWLEVIENAAANGIRPSAFREFIDMQVELAKRLAKK